MKALVCLSGGQDSTTCLYVAKRDFDDVQAVSFQYGQQHSLELRAAEEVCRIAQVPLKWLRVPALFEIGGGGLTQQGGDVTGAHPQFAELPGSFVPLRNLVLFSLAAAWAVKNNIQVVYSGINQTDYSGYPDCREVFIQSLEETIRLALGKQCYHPVQFLLPLIRLTKKQTVELAATLPGCMEALAYTHTCYHNLFPPCNVCPSCILRAKGFTEAGVKDPLFVRARWIEDHPDVPWRPEL